MRVPGGTAGLWCVATAGFLATAISVALVFVPPPDTVNVLNYEVNLIGQSAIVIGVGVALYWWSTRRLALADPMQLQEIRRGSPQVLVHAHEHDFVARRQQTATQELAPDGIARGVDVLAKRRHDRARHRDRATAGVRPRGGWWPPGSTPAGETSPACARCCRRASPRRSPSPVRGRPASPRPRTTRGRARPASDCRSRSPPAAAAARPRG